MPLDYTNPLVTKFLNENFAKADEKRMQWFHKNQEKIMKLAVFPENYKGLHILDVTKVTMDLAMPSIAVHNKTSSTYRRKKALRDGVLQGLSQLKIPSRRKGEQPKRPLEHYSDLLAPEPLMKPVDPDIKRILYEAQPFGGRRIYKDKRNRVLPEDKYNFCETNTHVYGWRLKDSQLSRQPTKYGRYFAFKRDLQSRSGPQPDPAFYSHPTKRFSKCDC